MSGNDFFCMNINSIRTKEILKDYEFYLGVSGEYAFVQALQHHLYNEDYQVPQVELAEQKVTDCASLCFVEFCNNDQMFLALVDNGAQLNCLHQA